MVFDPHNQSIKLSGGATGFSESGSCEESENLCRFQNENRPQSLPLSDLESNVETKLSVVDLAYTDRVLKDSHFVRETWWESYKGSFKVRLKKLTFNDLISDVKGALVLGVITHLSPVIGLGLMGFGVGYEIGHFYQRKQNALSLYHQAQTSRDFSLAVTALENAADVDAENTIHLIRTITTAGLLKGMSWGLKIFGTKLFPLPKEIEGSTRITPANDNAIPFPANDNGIDPNVVPLFPSTRPFPLRSTPSFEPMQPPVSAEPFNSLEPGEIRYGNLLLKPPLTALKLEVAAPFSPVGKIPEWVHARDFNSLPKIEFIQLPLDPATGLPISLKDYFFQKFLSSLKVSLGFPSNQTMMSLATPHSLGEALLKGLEDEELKRLSALLKQIESFLKLTTEDQKRMDELTNVTIALRNALGESRGAPPVFYHSTDQALTIEQMAQKIEELREKFGITLLHLGSDSFAPPLFSSKQLPLIDWKDRLYEIKTGGAVISPYLETEFVASAVLHFNENGNPFFIVYQPETGKEYFYPSSLSKEMVEKLRQYEGFLLGIRFKLISELPLANPPQNSYKIDLGSSLVVPPSNLNPEQTKKLPLNTPVIFEGTCLGVEIQEIEEPQNNGAIHIIPLKKIRLRLEDGQIVFIQLKTPKPIVYEGGMIVGERGKMIQAEGVPVQTNEKIRISASVTADGGIDAGSNLPFLLEPSAERISEIKEKDTETRKEVSHAIEKIVLLIKLRHYAGVRAIFSQIRKRELLLEDSIQLLTLIKQLPPQERPVCLKGPSFIERHVKRVEATYGILIENMTLNELLAFFGNKLSEDNEHAGILGSLYSVLYELKKGKVISSTTLLSILTDAFETRLQKLERYNSREYNADLRKAYQNEWHKLLIIVDKMIEVGEGFPVKTIHIVLDCMRYLMEKTEGEVPLSPKMKALVLGEAVSSLCSLLSRIFESDAKTIQYLYEEDILVWLEKLSRVPGIDPKSLQHLKDISEHVKGKKRSEARPENLLN